MSETATAQSQPTMAGFRTPELEQALRGRGVAPAYELALEDINPLNAHLFRENRWHDYFERLRREDPVHYHRESRYGPYWSVTRYDDFKAVLAVHLHGTFLFTREVAAQHWHPLFKESGNQPLRDGVNRFIVNFSSVSARNGNIGQIDYTAAKGAIEAGTRTTAREFASYGARINAIAPGPVNTAKCRLSPAGSSRTSSLMKLASLRLERTTQRNRRMPKTSSGTATARSCLTVT